MNCVSDISKELIRRYPYLFFHIDIEKIKFTEIESDFKPVLSINGLNKTAISLLDDHDVNVRYVVEVNMTFFEDCTINKLQWLILDMLLCVHDKCDGRLIKPFFTSHNVIVDAISKYQLGSNFLNHPNLPDLLGNENVDLF